MNDCLLPPSDEGTTMSTSTEATHAAATEPDDDKSCQVCHIPLDEKTMHNHGTKKMPYWMCLVTRECDLRVREARDRELQAEAEAEEPVEATT